MGKMVIWEYTAEETRLEQQILVNLFHKNNDKNPANQPRRGTGINRIQVLELVH
jgi:hypothetical protein